MRTNDVIYLIESEIKQNDFGQEIVVDKYKRLVYANKHRVGMSEHYNISEQFNSSTHSLRDTKAFNIHFSEYQDETEFEYNDKRYTITRVIDNLEHILIIGVARIGKN